MKVGSARVRFSCDVARSEGYRHAGDGRPDEWYLYLGGRRTGREVECVCGRRRELERLSVSGTRMRRGGEATAAAANRAPTMATHSNSRNQIATGGNRSYADVDGQWECLFLHGEEASRVTTAASRARRPWAMSESGNGGTSKCRSSATGLIAGGKCVHPVYPSLDTVSEPVGGETAGTHPGLYETGPAGEMSMRADRWTLAWRAHRRSEFPEPPIRGRHRQPGNRTRRKRMIMRNLGRSGP